jgi:regulator of protease activity HflC (stomatin/prohibitin superfamily)
MDEDLKTGIKVAVSIIVVFILINSFVIVNAGERGVLLTMGAVQDNIFNEGLHFKIPFVQSVKSMDVKIVKMEVKADAYSKDIQTVESLIALNYHLQPEKANKIYQTFRRDYEERIISPAVQESVKAITAKYTAQELIEKRGEVKEGIKVSLSDRLQKDNILVDELSIVNFDFSEGYEKAVEQKQIAQQNALTAQNNLEKVKFEAEQRIAQAKGEAEAIKIQAEAITQQGGKDYVNLKAVEKWDGKLPTNFVPGSAIPFINLPN